MERLADSRVYTKFEAGLNLTSPLAGNTCRRAIAKGRAGQ
jgi:hypothetical protein